jgi:hypothetical protein
LQPAIEHSTAQIFFSLGDMVILMLDKLMANVIIHSRLRDRFGSILPQYDCNLISISITFHRRRVVDETRQIRIAVGQVRIYLHEIGKIQSKAQSSSVTPTRFRTLTTPKKKHSEFRNVQDGHRNILKLKLARNSGVTYGDLTNLYYDVYQTGAS